MKEIITIFKHQPKQSLGEWMQNRSFNLREAKELEWRGVSDCGCGDCDNENLCPICLSFGEDSYSKSFIHSKGCKLNELIIHLERFL